MSQSKDCNSRIYQATSRIVRVEAYKRELDVLSAVVEYFRIICPKLEEESPVHRKQAPLHTRRTYRDDDKEKECVEEYQEEDELKSNPLNTTHGYIEMMTKKRNV